MNPSRWTRVTPLVAAVCLLLAACGSDPGGPPDDGGRPAPQDAAVQMADSAFAPTSVTITPGSTVTWTNNDSVPHTVSFSDEGPQSSETIDPGATFEATFEKAGSYAYVCTLHPGMEGVVEVTDDASAAGAGPINASSDETSAASLAPAAAVATGAAAAGLLPGSGTPGVDIALGEWALVSSAMEAPPGTITFRFRNLGTVPHALRIRTSGSGRDRLEWRAEAIGPGESGLLVADLPTGTYEIDCPIEDGHGEHDQLGMEILFTVHEGAVELAPLPGADSTQAASPGLEASDPAVAITGFAFQPLELRVPVGTMVTWNNTDPTPHTVTGEGFDTGVLEQDTTGSLTFGTAGIFDYFCAIHPAMKGRVVVGS